MLNSKEVIFVVFYAKGRTCCLCVVSYRCCVGRKGKRVVFKECLTGNVEFLIKMKIL